MMLNWNAIIKELKYTTARSGGSGGQHVNKVETKVTIHFDIEKSNFLSTEQKELLKLKLKSKLGQQSILTLYSQATRSQFKNKERVIQNFIELIKQSLVQHKKRVPTKMSKAVKEKILIHKRKRSAVKQMRKKPRLDSF